jgi:hypothetical protein
MTAAPGQKRPSRGNLPCGEEVLGPERMPERP